MATKLREQIAEFLGAPADQLGFTQTTSRWAADFDGWFDLDGTFLGNVEFKERPRSDSLVHLTVYEYQKALDVEALVVVATKHAAYIGWASQIQAAVTSAATTMARSPRGDMSYRIKTPDLVGSGFVEHKGSFIDAWPSGR